MTIRSIKTHIVKNGDSIKELLKIALKGMYLECCIVAITSKVISVCEQRIVPKSSIGNKRDLVYREADYVLDIDNNKEHIITIKNGILIPSAGIDESNVEDAYILYPKDVHATCVDIWEWLRTEFKVKHIGVIITDSHTTPMRVGVTGVGLSWCGFEAQYSYIGTKDIYGRPLKCTQVNVIDALAAAAVFEMGEAAEQTPIAIISDAPRVVYKDSATSEIEILNTNIPIEEDIYGDILMAVKWKKSSVRDR
jgi:putative folate metabolism gamma-glutamate ligase